MLDLADTIAAIASAAGGATRGIVRLSGPNVVACVGPLFSQQPTPSASHQPRLDLNRPRRYSGWLTLNEPLGEVPCDLYLWPTHRSYTHQPSAELHLPGSPPLLQAALAKVCRHGARLAQPGEFTLRAFLAGRLDLTQAEAVLGVIDAHSQRELEVALAQLAGGLATPLHQLREQLLDLLAHLEAGLDFVEEDIEFISAEELARQLSDIHAAIEHTRRQMHERNTSIDAYKIVLAGPPNAGKSSLLNALVGDDAAIVSEIAGTTRDYVLREITIDGLRCQIIDTAGLAGAAFTPDAAAEAHARAWLDQAHLVLLCRDATQTMAGETTARCLQVLTKHDLLPEAASIAQSSGLLAVSARTGFGLERLRAAIGRELRALEEQAAQVVANTSVRCRDSLGAAAEALARAQSVLLLQGGEELVAAELRLALEELGHVVGVVYTDDVLDRIFSRFCIGK